MRIFTEPQQGATYDDLLAVAQAAERLGFDAFFRSDHYLRIGAGAPGPGSTDAWVTLGALARETSRIRLGTLVTPVTFRLPGPLAVSVAQADQMSGGRIELGLGVGWFDAEHAAYGIPFPPIGQRFEMLEEQLDIVTGLWGAESPFSYAGKHYRLTDSPALPKPVQRPLPIIIGGAGARRTPRLAAAFATEYNIPFHGVEETGEAFHRVRAACDLTGRSIILSAAQTVCVGADEAEVARRAEAIDEDPAELRKTGLAGTPAEVLDKIHQFRELGAEHLYLQVMDLADLDHLELIAAEIMPHV
ncbi:LLM class F420-dependent oxidoreductase [Acrocarpospora corrugata]|uniref:LLM class F420-dependent oxidoreductase n=1 Tax=Acrocarpospora corrugata TaxID=35763 RepID=A0A5M3VNR6_9ACTN|nr:LLM class F420-dependent oxidoreductase [Acrocarpospora corrugata]